MLDNGTKRRIDNARDVLVGKVPDPKAQVEQITTALIYKFMDDMDQESIALGGKASFFVGEYAEYAWPKVMAKSLSGYERLGLYSEAIMKMSQNPHLPRLFRDIFKDAFLPYRDPETLNLFLKEIDGFKYDNSERLGDAFEYLLSVLGSQGAAGQFRTPRHIIDFIVNVIAPTKTDTVLDPACGTAGFLISAYKHILAKNQEKKLSPDEMVRLTRNFVGYDISPEMVRLSLVNMYLHQFPKPMVFEYDTLTSEERWDDSFDVIMANPPFMSPKGGIRPHTRFSVQAKRSEVLFVDYIAEHLNPNGRAGVIVPEGIIFQSAKAYKALRKMLIEENYLYAVVSLPAGVFNPYSGVKTSILLMDRTLAKQTDSILFVNIESDGYGLGAQRREINSNDLPEAVQIIKDFQKDPSKEPLHPHLAHIVAKSKIIVDGECNLSGIRYKDPKEYKNIKWPIVSLGQEEFFQIESGGTPSTKEPGYWGGNVNWVTLVDLPPDNFVTKITRTKRKITVEGLNNSSAKLLPTKSILVSSRATIGRIGINEVELATNQGFKNIVIRDFNKVSEKFVAFCLTKLVPRMIQLGSGGTYKEISKKEFLTLQIPLPPLDVQKAIVDEIEGYQKIIDGARQVVENYKPRIKVDPEWPMVELGEVCKTSSGGTPLRSKKEYYENGTISWLKSGEVSKGFIYLAEEKITEKGLQQSSAKLFPKDTVLVAMYGATAGQVGLLKFESSTNQAICGVFPGNNFIPEFIYYYLGTLTDDMVRMSSGGAQPNISQKIIKSLKIPFISIDKQKQMVSKIEEEENIVDGNKKLIEVFEKKIEEKIGEVWGEEE